MGRVRMTIACALLMCAGSLRSECVSQLREASSGVFNRSTAAVAWSGSVVGVAKVDESAREAISFATYSETLTPLTGDQLVTNSSLRGVVALLWNGSEFALFYQTDTARFVMQRISSTNQLIGSAVPVSGNHPLAADREYDVAWDPARNAYLVVQTAPTGLDKGIWLTTIGPDGTPLADEVITSFVTPPVSPRVVVNSSGSIAVLFRRDNDFLIRIFARDGSGGVIQPIVTARDARLASDGTVFAVVGNSLPAAPTQIDWAIIDGNGSVVLPQTKLFAARGVEIMPVSLYWNATLAEWALAYLDGRFPFNQSAPDYRLRRFTSAGGLVSDSTFSIDSLFTWLSTAQPFVWTGTSYVTAASASAPTTSHPESYVLRLCPLTAAVDASSQYIRSGDTVTFTVRPDGGAPDQTYTWDFGDFSGTATGRTVTHRYTRLGADTVTVRVTDSAGATTTGQVVIHVVQPKRRSARR